MKPLRDPERAELNHLTSACDLKGKLVLDIGCGDGKFTRQYQRMVRRLVGIDPELSDLHIAREKGDPARSLFLRAQAEDLPFSSEVFDIVLFTSSL